MRENQVILLGAAALGIVATTATSQSTVRPGEPLSFTRAGDAPFQARCTLSPAPKTVVFAWAEPRDAKFRLTLFDDRGQRLVAAQPKDGHTAAAVTATTATSVRIDVDGPAKSTRGVLHVRIAAETPESIEAGRSAKKALKAAAAATPTAARDLVTDAIAAATSAAGSSVAVDTHLNQLSLLAIRLGAVQSAVDGLRANRAFRAKRLPKDHLELLSVMRNLGIALRMAGQVEDSATVLQDVVNTLREARGERDLFVATTELTLGSTYSALRNYEQAQANQERALLTFAAKLPPHHDYVLKARGNLALALKNLGRVDLALAQERLVVAARTALAKSSGDSDLALARSNLADSLLVSGEFEEAERMARLALRTMHDQLPPDHPSYRNTQSILASICTQLGKDDEAGKLRQEVVESFRRRLPKNHPDLLIAELNSIGDLLRAGRIRSAVKLGQKVLTGLEAAFGSEDTSVFLACQNLATALEELGDIQQANRLAERAYRGLSSRRPATDLHVLRARATLASTLSDLGDEDTAHVHREAILELTTSTLAPNHPTTLRAQHNFAVGLQNAGRHQEAERILSALSKQHRNSLPPDHPNRITTTLSLANSLGELGRKAEAIDRLREALQDAGGNPTATAVRRNLAALLGETGKLDEAKALGQQALTTLEATRPRTSSWVCLTRSNLCWTLAQLGSIPELVRERQKLAASLIERLREAELTNAPRVARAQATDLRHRMHSVLWLGTWPPLAEQDPTSLATNFELIETARSVGYTAAQLAADSQARGATHRKLTDALTGAIERLSRVARDGNPKSLQAAVRAKEAAQARLIEHLRTSSNAQEIARPPTAAAIAKQLGSDEVAISIWRHVDWQSATDVAGIESYSAYVLRPDEQIQHIALGEAEALNRAIERWHQQLASGGSLERKVGEQVHARLIQPLIEAAGSAKRWIVALDDALHTVPLDALPHGQGRLGDEKVIEVRSNLRELGRTSNRASSNTLIAFGDIDYGAEIIPSAAVPIEPSTRGRRTFSALPMTGPEVRALAKVHLRAHDDQARRVVTGSDASRERLFELAPTAGYLHLATHAYFSNELSGQTRRGARNAWRTTHRARTFSPLVFCGVALAGAASDQARKEPGIGCVTAEELAHLDLHHCRLAVLSACNSNVGIRRAGQGVFSLQQALHAAGVHTAVASLWAVDDTSTRQLMEAFYRELWLNDAPPREALWRAKMTVRRSPRSQPRDWAGWVVTGARPSNR